MTEQNAIDEKIYAADGKPASMHDMLHYFSRLGPMRVSDLHLKVGQAPHYRIDGELQAVKGPPLDEATLKTLLMPLLGEGEKRTLEKDRSVDTSFDDKTMQYRLNVFHDNEGLAAAIRALEGDIPPVEALGFPNRIWEDIVEMNRGLVILTGITGSGKSTTIASLLNHISATRACRIITMEDPIEYRLVSRKSVISQREVGRDVPSFARGLRDALREDPDVIFVGEMRDQESASWTLTAAETGHLVFSTLHTRDTRGTITRLMDMYPEGRQQEIASQLALSLKYCIAQKLVPRADGQGRVVAMEILQNNYSIANLIRNGKVEQIYSQLQMHSGNNDKQDRMQTMERSLADLVAAGAITPLQAESWAEDIASFQDEMQRIQKH